LGYRLVLIIAVLKKIIFMSRFLIIILSLVTVAAFGQTSKSLDFHFVKPENTLQAKHPSHFNSLKITNTSADSALLHLELVMPKGWKLAVFMPIPDDVMVAPHDSIFIPIKILLPKYTKGGKTYAYRMEIFDGNKKFLGDTKANLFVPEFSEWEVEVLEGELYLPLDSSEITFKTRITNKGNKTETIALQYRIQDKIASKRIDIEPGFDSTLTLTAEYSTYENNKDANREYIGITASDGLNVQDKSIYFVRFKNDYNGLRSTKRPNSIGFLYDNFPSQNLSTLGFRAIGSMTFKDDAEFSYFIMNTDLSNFNQYDRSTVYRLQYLSEQIDIGVGSTFDYGYRLNRINTISGRRPIQNGNNALSVTWRPYTHNVHQTTIFVSRNILQPITTVIGGHRIRLGRGSVEGGFTYNLDFFGKKSLKIGAIHARLPIGMNHYIEVLANGAEESYHFLSAGDHTIDTIYKNPNEVYRDQSLSYRVFYNGRLADGLNLNISNAYTSPYYPNGERGLFNFNTQLSYQSKNRRTVKLGYRLQDKAPYTYQYSLPLGVLGYRRQNIFTEYQMPIGTFSTIQAGTLIQKHETERLSNVTTDFSYFSSSDFKIYMGSQSQFGQHYFRFNILYGYAFVADFMNSDGVHLSGIPRIPAMDIQTEYSKRDFRFGLNYISGPNGTISNYSTDNNDDLFAQQLRLYSAWQHYFFERKLRISMSATSFYQISQTRGSFAITPRVEFFSKNNWRIDANAALSYNVLAQNNVWQTQFNPRFQVGIYRDFYIAPDEKHYDLEVICFKDDNGNGQKESHEFGLPDVKIAVIPILNKKNRNSKKQPIKLFSNHKGFLFFKKISEGQYQIVAEQVHNNQQGYILEETTPQIIDLKENMVVYIPFAKANTVKGKVTYDKSKYSNTNIDVANIRITATSNTGEIYNVLTDKNGNYSLSLPDSKFYTITIHNPFLEKIYLKEKTFDINFEKNKELDINFEFFEKKRKVNFD
jgi:hypothetical protein